MPDDGERDRLIEIARREMAERRPIAARPVGHFFHHGKRTAAIALRLAEELGDRAGDLDRSVLFAAGLFHDVTKGDEPHNETGAARTAELLREVMDAPRLTAVADLIRQHNLRRRPELPLAAHILQDADLLDHHGSQVVWLAFHWSAAAGEDPWQSADYYFGEEHSRYLDECRACLNLDLAREVFDRRRRFGDEFFRRFREELDGAL